MDNMDEDSEHSCCPFPICSISGLEYSELTYTGHHDLLSDFQNMT